jgi:sigma-54 dependent transcriptional regulator, acetoin dehydrogenase operon transcriptional activator AcoR
MSQFINSSNVGEGIPSISCDKAYESEANPGQSSSNSKAFHSMDKSFRNFDSNMLNQKMQYSALDELDFGDTKMKRNIKCSKKLLHKDVPFLLLGETGTGKDVFAHALHDAGDRANNAFVAVNCASLPETLIESELFGYVPGAFTGASSQGARGKIAQADGGTLFLDEIGDMPCHLQARLLRVLEEREVAPLGSEKPIKVDIRLISATHQNIEKKIVRGEFREDLYYRINGIKLTMPSLRDRSDKRNIILHLVEVESKDKYDTKIDDLALDVLCAYTWPGNIRQLRSVLRILVCLCDKRVIKLNDIPDEILCAVMESRSPQGNHPKTSLDVAEREVLTRELESVYWNVSRAAAKLCISRNTLYEKMKRLHIFRPAT